MRLACESCGGTGRVRDATGHTDICDKCLGLGYVDSKEEVESGETRKRSNRFYLIMVLFAFILGFYYVGLYIALTLYGFSLIVTMVLFVGGHLLIFGGFLMYVLLRVLNSNTES